MYVVPGLNTLSSNFTHHIIVLWDVVSYPSPSPFCENAAVPLSLPVPQALVGLTKKLTQSPTRDGERCPCSEAWGSLRAPAGGRFLELRGRKRSGVVSFLLRSGDRSAFVTGLVPVSLAKWNNPQDLEFLTNYSGLKG